MAPTQPAPLEQGDISTGRAGDAIFAGLARSSGFTILLALAGVATFLVVQGIGALDNHGEETFGRANIWAYVWPLVFGTLWASFIALLIATPLSIGLALVISHYAPRRVAKPIGWMVDLLAAIPSVVYGIWGITFVAPRLVPIYGWLNENFGSENGFLGLDWTWLPFFTGDVLQSGRTIFTAGVVLAIMAMPIITAICREIFAQTPRMHEEAALALGATRWEMIRMTVFPYGRSGMISAVLLGLGRALGETMAVALVLSPALIVSFNLVEAQNPSTIAANIALSFPEASGEKVATLIFTGLVLFVITFAVNFLGRWITARGRVGR